MNKRITYSNEFKQAAVRQLEQGGKSTAELARELGVYSCTYNSNSNILSACLRDACISTSML